MPDARFRVLAVIDGYRLTGPARQLFASRRCERAAITVATFQRAAEPTPFVMAALRLNLPTFILPDRFPGDPRTVVALTKLASNGATDILQTHGYKPNILAALVRGRVRRPWIAFMHGETWDNWKVRVYFALERLAIRSADRVVVVSHQMARALEARGIPRAKLRVIHNACLREPRSDDHYAPWSPDAPPMIGVVGRLSYEKGVDIALRAHRLVIQQCPATRLLVAGEGPEQRRLIRLAERLGIASSVEWLGYREDVEPLYRRMTALVIPSRSEGLPNVALEAMACGIPVIATAVGGLPEVVSDDRTGFLVPPGDATELASRVLQVIADRTLCQRLGRAACDEVRARFSPGARCRALAGLYAEALA